MFNYFIIYVMNMDWLVKTIDCMYTQYDQADIKQLQF